MSSPGTNPSNEQAVSANGQKGTPTMSTTTEDRRRAEEETEGRFNLIALAPRTSKTKAAEEALATYDGKPTKKFVERLSDGSLTVKDGEVVRVN